MTKRETDLLHFFAAVVKARPDKEPGYLEAWVRDLCDAAGQYRGLQVKRSETDLSNWQLTREATLQGKMLELAKEIDCDIRMRGDVRGHTVIVSFDGHLEYPLGMGVPGS